MLVDQAIAQRIESLSELIVAVQHMSSIRRHFIGADKAQVIRLGFFESVFVAKVLWFPGDPLVQQLEITLLGGFEGLGIGALAKHDD
ncbi:hypothetical protein D3C87_1548760 [compost metagenome]